MDQLFLECFLLNDKICLTLESKISLFIYKILDDPKNIEIQLIETENKQYLNLTAVNQKCIENFPKFKYENSPILAKSCKLPIFITDKNTVISGLCGVSRGIIKNCLKSGENEFAENLLGFKSACLLSPTESSVWTKFCEIDIFNCYRSFLHSTASLKNFIVLPNEFSKFESHMKQPVRLHNVYGLARDLDKKKNLTQKLKELVLRERVLTPRINKTKKPKEIKISSSISVEELKIEHKFMEGHKITLADVILFNYFFLMFNWIPEKSNINHEIPLTLKWYDVMKNFNSGKLFKILNEISVPTETYRQPMKLELEPLENYSLYKSEPKGVKSKKAFTKQEDVEISLEKIKKIKIKINSENSSPGQKLIFNWNNLPLAVLPEGGDLPEKRLQRKKDQLESLAKEVIAIAKDGDVIVDFCCGAGHLGLLLAFKLPNCKIILLENKEESLTRAKNRAVILQLKNVSYFQSNLDYFTADFNIGTSLHACGVATDIVLSHCMNKRASFVSCPCCYGKILEMPHILYPRSRIYRENGISNLDYMILAHCSDQTHDIEKANCNVEKSLQGGVCMDVIDTDRKLKAEELGYKVLLTRLQPEDCTLKNRLLIGILK